MAVKGAKALEVWARRVTDGYPNVKIRDMSSSWRNGLAFCAILHRFRPDLIDFDSMDPNQIERNCATVFRIAEEKLGIPSLLDPADMAECGSPDRLSILTYLSEFYHTFKSEKSPSGSPHTCKKEETGVDQSQSRMKSSTNQNKPCPELKRKDSCDSGVSVSPLGSVCNSPPHQRKDSSDLTTANIKLEHNVEVPSPIKAPVTKTSSLTNMPLYSPVRSLDNSSSESQTTSLPVEQIKDSSSPSASGLDNLLRQRLKISLDSSRSPVVSGLDTSLNQRKNLLQSMISVSNSGSDTGPTILSENQTNNNNKDAAKNTRRHTLGSDVLHDTNVRGRGRVSQLSQSFANPCDSANSKYVSKTTISLNSTNPIKYAPNNSVTCDVKSISNNISPKPWSQFNKSSPAAPVTSSTPKRSVSSSHLLHLHVNNSPIARQENQNQPITNGESKPVNNPLNTIIIDPSSASSSKLKSSISSSKLNSTVSSSSDLNCNVTRVTDNNEAGETNSFKSRMMKFESLINPSLGGHVVAKRVNLSLSHHEESNYPSLDDPGAAGVKQDRRKTISFPASFALSSVDPQDSRLTF